MFKKIAEKFKGDPLQKTIEEYAETVNQINNLEPEIEALTDDQLKAKTAEFKERLAKGETLDDLLPEAFAVVRETSKRTLGMRHFDTQLIGGIILHQGHVAEMRTGEGKTLMSTLPIYLNALTGGGVHLITVNDYLARRDARWMAPIFNFLGLSVGVLQMGSRTESGRKGFVVDLEKEHAQEDQHQLVMVDRSESYAADITYGTNNEFGFDYLRDNMKSTLKDRSQRGHNYAIIDEVDNVLIDEARTPLIISGPSHDDAQNYIDMAQVVKQLRSEDYEVNEKDRTATLTEIGETRVEDLLGQPLRDPDRPEDITPEQARTLGFLEQAMRAQFLYKRNKEYIVQSGQVVIVDEFTGRLMPGRRWSDGLHQAVEAKEGVKVQSENITHATITIQNYFRMYEKLSGMTGTALTEAEEFSKIYDLEVFPVPPIVEYNASGETAFLNAHTAVDDYYYEYTYYAHKDDPDQKQVFFKRKDYPDVVFRTLEAKLRAIVQEIITYSCIGTPILVGTTSVESSERLSTRLKSDAVRKLLQALLVRKVWMEQNNREEDGRFIMALAYLYEPLEKLDTNQMRQMAKDLGISLSLEEPNNMARLLSYLGLEEEHKLRFQDMLKTGATHQVLNARKHTEESRIIAGAGAFGAVTIATNMAGRGVDIKLGGEVAEEVITTVNRVLKRTGETDPYDMSMEERLEAVKNLSSEELGIYESEIKFFIQSMSQMSKVKELGGLHVIGSERHEARRIDNQLRGRAARLGDPGSSRFFLSMEDELMRLFGGQQMEVMMQRLGMDEAMPLELGLVSRIIESAQTRVEGANFDVRKHLLEYDDVLNAQRATIYTQRDLIITKDDLHADVLEMLETEIGMRVPEAMVDKEGPWKLLSWLDQTQPAIPLKDGTVYPSFTMRILLDAIKEKPHNTPQEALPTIMSIAENAMHIEEERMVDSAKATLKQIQDRFETTLNERLDTLDTFFETLGYADETDTRSLKDLADEINSLARVPIKLSNNEQRLLKTDPNQVADLVYERLEQEMVAQAVTRLIGAIERRLGGSLGLSPGKLASEDWDTIEDQILDAVKNGFQTKRQRLIGEDHDGILAREALEQLNKADNGIDDKTLLKTLTAITIEEVSGFDKKTHRQVKIQTSRFNYLFFAAKQVAKISEEKITEKVTTHLLEAQKAILQVWGESVWEQISQTTLMNLQERAHKAVESALGKEAVEKFKAQPLENASPVEQKAISTQIGWIEVNEIYRQVILRVISELWIEYLTQMEALRVSIGLEAYGQRDPLVVYKTKASQMFQALFDDMRKSVVNRLFTFRPRQQQAAQRMAAPQRTPQQRTAPAKEEAQAGEQPKKKRRRRRKKK